MSSYYIQAKNKETGEEVRIAAIDDYFGSHRYGYIPNYEFGTDFSKKEVVLNEDEYHKLYERV